MNNAILTFRIITLIAAAYIAYWFYDFYSEAVPTMYVAVADHLVLANTSHVFAAEAYKAMQDGKLTDDEYHKLYSVGLLESGDFKQINHTTLTREQAKQLLIDSL